MSTTTTLTVLDVLEGARSLVARPDGWCRGWSTLPHYGKTPQVNAVTAVVVASGDGTLFDDSAVFDLIPLRRPESLSTKALIALADVVPEHPGFWSARWQIAWNTVSYFNYHSDQVGVVAAFDRAITVEKQS